MIYWQISGATVKWQIFDKSYREQLNWYYRQFLEGAVADDYTLIFNGQYVLKNPLQLVEALAPKKDAPAACVYYCERDALAIVLPNDAREQLGGQVAESSFAALLAKIEHRAIALEMKAKKKRLAHLETGAGVSRFMKWLNAVKQRQLVRAGVLIWDKKSTWLAPTVQVGSGSIIYPNSTLRGDTTIGKNCSIGPAAHIVDSQLGDAVSVVNSTITASSVDDNTNIGPYAYLRPHSDIGKGVKIGDFVEVKNARIDDGAKVSHLSYIGDGFVGKAVNVGCGTVFVNYDGFNKHQTVVEDNCFIGCNANLIAPVTVGKGAYVAAGSTITGDVAADSLAIARARQVDKPNWAKKWTEKQSDK